MIKVTYKDTRTTGVFVTFEHTSQFFLVLILNRKMFPG